MGDTLTKQQVKRDDFLRMLALDPGEALRHWKNLRTGEPMVVITYMTIAYGVDFARHFKQQADKHKRPDLLITVTNFPSVTPDSLAKRGFKFQRRFEVPALNSVMEIWVNPSGQEVWRIPAAKSTPPAAAAAAPPPLPPTKKRVHPDVEELRIYVQQYSTRKTDIVNEGREIERSRPGLTKQQYHKLRDGWWELQQGWEGEIEEIRTEIIPEMTDDLTADEEKEKKALIDQLLNLMVSWPRDVFEPPPFP
jgi:hypothetical protein